jgi:hypothetical protein
MKTSRLLFIVLLSFAFAALSCKKEEATPTDDCRISASVDGVPYRWDLLTDCSLANGFLQVGNIAFDEAELTITPIDGKGSFPTVNPNFTITFFLSLDATTQIYAADVEIEVTSFSQARVEGTFEGIFTDISGNTYQVANGKFRSVF